MIVRFLLTTILTTAVLSLAPLPARAASTSPGSSSKSMQLDLTTKILTKIQEDAEAFCEEMREFRRETRTRFDHLTHRVDALTLRVENGFADVNVRIDRVIDMFGRYHADHEARIVRLEERTPPG